MINLVLKKSDKVNSYSGNSAFIDFPYNANLINEIKGYPTIKRYWHSQTKQWEIDVDYVPQFIKFAGTYKISIIGRNEPHSNRLQFKKNKIEENGFGFNIDSDFELLKFLKEDCHLTSNLYKHQLDAVRNYLKADGNGSVYIGDEAGLGKSLSATMIALAEQKLKGFPTTLIICCVNDLKWNFYRDILKHTNLYPANVQILGMHYKTSGSRRFEDIIIGDSKEKLEHLDMLVKSTKFLITNIESLRNKDIVNGLNKLCKKGIIGQVIVDEAHKIANPQAQQTQGLLKLDPAQRIPMSGTPNNTPLGLWAPLYWMGVESNGFGAFKRHYCYLGHHREVIGYKNMDQLQEMLSSVMIRRKKEDVLDLPEKNFYIDYVEMDSLQNKLYAFARDSVLANLDEIIGSNNPLVKMLKMRQATGNTWSLAEDLETDIFNNVRCAKLERLKDIIEERTDNGAKCIVFSNWVEVTSKLKTELAKYNPVVIDGTIKPKDKREAEIKFQNDENCKVLIGTIKSMGTGLNLTAASCAVFMDEPFTWIDFSQATDRLHRIGTSGSIDIISLITKDTIDEKIHDIISTKKDVSDYVVDGEKPDKGKIVRFLLGLD